MGTPLNRDVLLRVSDLRKYYSLRGGFLDRPQRLVKAVDGVSFDLERGQTLGLVGESGSGKTTLGRCSLRLEEPTSGEVHFGGHDLLALNAETLRQLRPQFQMVYQDPYSSLDPHMKVSTIVSEPLRIQGRGGRDSRSRVKEVLEQVGLSKHDLDKYPHVFSGGQRQRISLARALITQPSLLVLDEPTSGLDASVQARLLVLLRRLQEQMGLAYLFISHDMRLIRYMSDMVAVMWHGRIVERGQTQMIFDEPDHAYTRVLLRAMPRADPNLRLSDLLGPVE